MALKPKRVKGNTGNRVEQAILDVANYPARLVQVIDQGLQKNDFDADKVDHMLRLTYELTGEFMKDKDGNDVEDKPRWISEEIKLIDLPVGMSVPDVYNDQYRGKSKMVLRAKAFDPKGESEFDFSEMLGQPCLVFIGEKARKKDGVKYNVVGSVSSPMKGMTTPDLVNEATLFTLDEPDADVFRSLPEFLQDIIKGNLEYRGSALEKALEGGPEKSQEEEEVVEDTPAPKKKAPAKKAKPEPEEEEEEDDNQPW